MPGNTMRIFFLFFFAILFAFYDVSIAQRDPPVWEAFLSSISIDHGQHNDLIFNFEFRKYNGPSGHFERQMYLIAYLEKDEQEVFNVLADRNLLDKNSDKQKLFLDVLVDKKLVAVVESKTAKCQTLAGEDSQSEGDEENKRLVGESPDSGYQFEFSLKNTKLLEIALKLGNFDPANSINNRGTFFKDKIKFIVFVPVNDSKYAAKVATEMRGIYDFAKHDPNTDSGRELFYLDTAVLLMKTLPYRFSMKRMESGKIWIRID